MNDRLKNTIFAGAFTNAAPGIICHIAIILPLVPALPSAKLIR